MEEALDLSFDITDDDDDDDDDDDIRLTIDVIYQSPWREETIGYIL